MLPHAKLTVCMRALCVYVNWVNCKCCPLFKLAPCAGVGLVSELPEGSCELTTELLN